MVPWYVIDTQGRALGAYSLKCLALRAVQDATGLDTRTRKLRAGFWSVRHTPYWLVRADVLCEMRGHPPVYQQSA